MPVVRVSHVQLTKVDASRDGYNIWIVLGQTGNISGVALVLTGFVEQGRSLSVSDYNRSRTSGAGISFHNAVLFQFFERFASCVLRFAYGSCNLSSTPLLFLAECSLGMEVVHYFLIYGRSRQRNNRLLYARIMALDFTIEVLNSLIAASFGDCVARWEWSSLHSDYATTR